LRGEMRGSGDHPGVVGRESKISRSYRYIRSRGLLPYRFEIIPRQQLTLFFWRFLTLGRHRYRLTLREKVTKGQVT